MTSVQSSALDLSVTYIETNRIKHNAANARTHSKRQIKQIASSIDCFGFTCPVLVDEDAVLIAGHGRLAAAELLGIKSIPAISISGLSPAKKRALALADNKIPTNAGWDREKLVAELKILQDDLVLENIDLSITGFDAPEIDALHEDLDGLPDPADEVPPARGPAVTRPNDLWRLDKHLLLCGDARSSEVLSRLMGSELVQMAFLDPPYNVAVRTIVGRGRTKHAEFAMASGEMTAKQFTVFLAEALGAAAKVSADGAIHFVCMDWRHVGELLDAGRSVYGAMLNLIVWAKSNAGQGSFYRSQHELIGAFRVGGSAHRNNIELGRHGRTRSNVWRYAGANTFRSDRMVDLRDHPTVKPVTMVADAIKDCTSRGEIVLDLFAGSGTTILAAERVGRRARALEIEPKYVDVAIRRWQSFTGRDAVHVDTGLVFEELSEKRSRDDSVGVPRERGCG